MIETLLLGAVAVVGGIGLIGLIALMQAPPKAIARDRGVQIQRERTRAHAAHLTKAVSDTEVIEGAALTVTLPIDAGHAVVFHARTLDDPLRLNPTGLGRTPYDLLDDLAVHEALLADEQWTNSSLHGRTLILEYEEQMSLHDLAERGLEIGEALAAAWHRPWSEAAARFGLSYDDEQTLTGELDGGVLTVHCPPPSRETTVELVPAQPMPGFSARPRSGAAPVGDFLLDGRVILDDRLIAAAGESLEEERDLLAQVLLGLGGEVVEGRITAILPGRALSELAPAIEAVRDLHRLLRELAEATA